MEVPGSSAMPVRRIAVNPRVLVVAEMGWEDGTREVLKADGVDGVLNRTPVELDLDLEESGPDRSPGSGEPGPEQVTLRFGSLADFSPDRLVTQVPRWACWVRLRQLLEAGRLGKKPRNEVVDELAEFEEIAGVTDLLTGAAPTEGSIGEDEAEAMGASSVAEGPTADRGETDSTGRFEQLLDGIDWSEDRSREGETPEERLANAAGKLFTDTSSAVFVRQLEQAIRALDALLGAVVSAVVESSRWRSLETTWRGIALLARQTRALGFSIELLSSERETFLQTFYEECFDTEYRREPEEPLALVLCAYDLGPAAEDFEDVETAARFGDSLRVPFLFQMQAAFWGAKRPALLAGLPDLAKTLEGASYQSWRRFRAEESASWVFFTINRSLARAPWGGSNGGRVRSFELATDATRPLWIGVCWSLAAVACRAHAVSGARLRFRDCSIDDLPLTTLVPRRGPSFAYPLETLLRPRRIRELATLGVTAPWAEKGNGKVSFESIPSWHLPTVYEQDSATRASERAATLPQRIFAALVTHRFERLAESLQEDLDDLEALRERLGRELEPYLDSAMDSAQQLFVEHEDGVLFVRLKPSFGVGEGSLDLVLSVPVVDPEPQPA